MSLLLLPCNTMGALTLSPLPSSPSLALLLPSLCLFLLYGVWSPHPLETHEWQASPPLITVYSNSDTVAQKHTRTHTERDTHIKKIICCRIQDWHSHVAFFFFFPAERHVDIEAKCQGEIFNSMCTQTCMRPGADSVWRVEAKCQGMM